MWYTEIDKQTNRQTDKQTTIQWNPSIAATLGEQHFGRYVGMAFIEGLFCTQIVRLGPGSWPLYRGGLYSRVERGSTIIRVRPRASG